MQTQQTDRLLQQNVPADMLDPQTVDDYLPPVGSLLLFAGLVDVQHTLPVGWLLCDGSAVSRTTYSALFAALGTTYGAGDGTTTFNLPDCRGRAAFGKDDMGGAAANRVTSGNSGIAGTTLGAAGGSELMHQHTHAATVTDPGHTHTATVTDPGHTHSVGMTSSVSLAGTGNNAISGASSVITSSSASGVTVANASVSTGVTVGNADTGAGTSQNMPPALIVNVLIKF